MAACAIVSFMLLVARAVSAENPPVSPQSFRYSILPGERVMDFCARLERKGISSSGIFLRIASTAEFPDFPFVPRPRAALNRFEGLFVPGNYAVELDGVSAEQLSCDQKLALTREIIVQQLRASALRFRPFQSRIGLNLDQTIALASILEKEAVNGRDYGMIASVFANRLRANIPLASCPAVEYFLGYHRPYLLLSDIRVDSPYNLYLHCGLPPTPISFFSTAAFRAAIDPPKSSNLFLVYDWARGRHYFAPDYVMHRANMARSLRHFVEAYGEAAMFRTHAGKFYQN